MPERVLTLHELNRTTLLRQMLLRRARVGLVAAVERTGGLQAQEPRSPYVALWARLEGLRRETVERAIRREALVKATVMRMTLHLVSARDFRLYAAAMDESWRRRRGDAKLDPAVRRLVALADARPLQWSEVVAFLEGELGSTLAFRDVNLAQIGVLARLRQTPDSAAWGYYGRRWYIPAAVDEAAAEDGFVHLVRRYLAAFGPASRADLSQWSGVPLRDLDPAVARLPLRTFRDEDGRRLLDLPRARIATGGERAPVRLLPWFEQLLFAYDRRARVIPDELRAAIIKGGVSEAPFTVDGFVSGRWRLRGSRVEVEPLATITRTQRAELEDEARRLEAFVR